MTAEMKQKRSWLLVAALGAGIAIIGYTVLREFFGISLGERFEKGFFDAIFVLAIGLVLINRKLVSDEKKTEQKDSSAEK